MAATFLYSQPPASACRPETVTEEEMVELAYQELGQCQSRLVSRKRRQEGGGAVGEREEEAEEVMWEGMVRREIEAGAEEVWEMVASFGKMKRWNANVEVCEVVEGEEDAPGCVRFCAGGGKAPDGSPQRWVREKLLTMRPSQRCFTYCILDSSYGFQGYTATLSILPAFHHQAAAVVATSLPPTRALVHWNFQLLPIPHTPPPQLLSFVTSIFDNMMSSLERSILSPPPPLMS